MNAFDRPTAQLKARPWHYRLRIWAHVRWQLLRLDLCGASLFTHLRDDGSEFVVAKRPWLYRLLVSRHMEIQKP